MRRKKGKMTKIQNMLTMSSVITGLVLIFSFQVLAEEIEIQGWDKAKFGMSPKELRNAYVEEEEYFKPGAFWEEEREDKFSHVPYTLFTSKLTMLGKKGRVIFFFVNNKLFEVIIATGSTPGKEIEFSPGQFIVKWMARESKGVMSREERKRKMMEALEQLKLMKEKRQKEAAKDEISRTDLTSSIMQAAHSLGLDLERKEEGIIAGMKEDIPMELLADRYGEPSIVAWENGAIHRWDDEKGNVLILQDLFPVSVRGSSAFYSFIITYSNKELMKLWIAKIEEWEKERKRITEKGIEVF